MINGIQYEHNTEEKDKINEIYCQIVIVFDSATSIITIINNNKNSMVKPVPNGDSRDQNNCPL